MDLIELDPEGVAPGGGRRGWQRAAHKELLRRREQAAQPIARSRADRLLDAVGRLEESQRVEIQASEAYERWQADRRAGGVPGQKLGMPPKPYTPPAVPEGVMNKTDPDSRMMRTQGQPTVQGYNAQAAVTRGPIIVAAEIAVESPDFGHLEPAAAALCASSGTRVSHNAPRPSWPTRATGTPDRWRTSSATASKCWSRPMPGYARTPDRDGRKAPTRSCAECSQPRPGPRALQAPQSHSRAGLRPEQIQPRLPPVPVHERGRSAVRSGWSRATAAIVRGGSTLAPRQTSASSCDWASLAAARGFWCRPTRASRRAPFEGAS